KPQGDFIWKRPYSTPSRRRPRSMSLRGSALGSVGFLDDLSSISDFLAWKVQAVRPTLNEDQFPEAQMPESSIEAEIEMPVLAPVVAPVVAENGDAAEASPAWTAVFSLAMGVFGLVTAEFLPASLLTPIAADLGVSAGAAGQAVTATALTGTFAGILMPILTRHLDRRLVMWSLTSLLVISGVLAAVATNLTLLLAARLLLGIGIGGFWSMMAAMAMRLVPERLLPRALSIVFAGVSVATISAAPIGAYLGDLYGWRTVFILS